jgi:hypothetical protein
MTARLKVPRLKFFRRRSGSERGDLSDPIAREAHFRKLILRVMTASLFFANTVLFAILLPFYPAGLSIMLGIIVAVIGYVFPPAGFFASIVISLPALMYQTGVPLWWLAILLIFTIIFSVRTFFDSNNTLTPSIGVLAAAITLTPAYFIVIPIMIAVLLFRQKERLFAPFGVVITFLIFFIPIHYAEFSSILMVSLGEKIQTMRAEEIYGAMNSIIIPIFHQLSINIHPVPQSFDLPALSQAFGSTSESSKFFHPYLFLMMDRLIVFFFPVLVTITLSVSLVIQRFWYWLRDRNSSVAPIVRFSSIITILIGTTMFILPLVALSPALRYFTVVNSIVPSEALAGGTALLVLILSSIAIGLLVAMVSQLSVRRDSIANTASAITGKSKELSSALQELFNYALNVNESCQGISMVEELTQLGRSNEEVKLTEKNLGTLRPSFMAERLAKFNKVGDDMPRIKESVNRKLGNFYMDKVAKYNSIVRQITAFGIQGLKKVVEPTEDQIVKMGDDLLKVQQTLNEMYLDLANKTFEVTKGLVETINLEFENIDTTSVEIGKKFLDDKKGEVALDYLINTLAQLDARYGRLVQNVVEKEDSIARGIINIYSVQMLAMFETLGKAETSSQSYGVISKLTDTLNRPNSIGIAYLTQAMIRFQIIQDSLKTISSELMSHMAELEALNDTRAPGFNWGKDTTIIIELETALKAMQSREKLGIDERMVNAEIALKSIEEATKTISEYIVMSELILLYPLFDQLISAKLRGSGAVKPEEIPATSRYAKQLLRLYASRHANVAFDIMANRLQLK